MTNEISHPCHHGNESVLCLQCHKDEIERLRSDISLAYNLRDAAEGRYCTALDTIERMQEHFRGLGWRYDVERKTLVDLRLGGEPTCELPSCECLLRDKSPSAYHAPKCPRYVEGKL